jgi:glycosyltransferase involved in cell wall biosynthesis
MTRRVFGWHGSIPGCAYYRVQLPLRTLNQQDGWSASYGRALPLPEEIRDGRATSVQDVVSHMADRFDVIVAQQVGAGGTGADITFEHFARSGKFMTVLETDDNLLALHAGHGDEARQEMVERAAAYRRAAEVADLVTVTTPALAEVMSKINKNVKIVPNYIDAAMFQLPGSGTGIPPTRIIESGGWSRWRPQWPGPEQMLIGWGGSSTHRDDFAIAWPGLKRLLLQRPEICFATMGVKHHADDPAMDRLERRSQVAGLAWLDMNKHPWHEYWKRVGYYDIGIAPLEMNEFNRSKSWIKILEYCAMGVPFVASASPEYCRFVESGKHLKQAIDSFGILVEHPYQWHAALSAITSDWAELQRMQARARMYARQFTIQGNIQEWVSALAGQEKT